MTFIAPCFIRRNTPSLIKSLKALGYASGENYGKWNIICENGKYITGKVIRENDKSKFIDCGVNEQLFLALAALRNDSDYMQWFVSHHLVIFTPMRGQSSVKQAFTGDFFLCKKEDGKSLIASFIELPGEAKETWHKATVEELKKHFERDVGR